MVGFADLGAGSTLFLRTAMTYEQIRADDTAGKYRLVRLMMKR
jgi:hypothetical protein